MFLIELCGWKKLIKCSLMQGGFKQLKVNKVCVSFVELEILSLAFKSNC